jgi:E3 ubiquitin-protein ligase RNF216
MADIIEISDYSSRAPVFTRHSLGFIDISSSDDEHMLTAGTSVNASSNDQMSPGNDVYSQYVARVLEIVPDVKPEYAMELVQSCHERFGDGVMEPVLHALFENNSYPKIETGKGKGKGKRKREDDEPSGREKTLKLDYGSKDRMAPGGPNYKPLALASLC